MTPTCMPEPAPATDSARRGAAVQGALRRAEMFLGATFADFIATRPDTTTPWRWIVREPTQDAADVLIPWTNGGERGIQRPLYSMEAHAWRTRRCELAAALAPVELSGTSFKAGIHSLTPPDLSALAAAIHDEFLMTVFALDATTTSNPDTVALRDWYLASCKRGSRPGFMMLLGPKTELVPYFGANLPPRALCGRMQRLVDAAVATAPDWFAHTSGTANLCLCDSAPSAHEIADLLIRRRAA